MKIEYQKNYIYIKDQDQEVGYIRFNYKDDQVIDVLTTYVNAEYRGQGIAGKLFAELVSFCRKQHLQIIPSCSYIKNKLENSHEYDDIYVK